MNLAGSIALNNPHFWKGDLENFGNQSKNRLNEYRYGFNGKESDPEFKGGASYDYGFRIYDARLGKFLSVDPLTGSYPWYTPYQFAGNKPIRYSDLDGLEEFDVFIDIPNGRVWLQVKNADIPDNDTKVVVHYYEFDKNGKKKYVKTSNQFNYGPEQARQESMAFKYPVKGRPGKSFGEKNYRESKEIDEWEGGVTQRTFFLKSPTQSSSPEKEVNNSHKIEKEVPYTMTSEFKAPEGLDISKIKDLYDGLSDRLNDGEILKIYGGNKDDHDTIMDELIDRGSANTHRIEFYSDQEGQDPNKIVIRSFEKKE